MSSCSSTHGDGEDASCCFQKIQVSGPMEREKNVKQMSSWVCKHSQTPPPPPTHSTMLRGKNINSDEMLY